MRSPILALLLLASVSYASPKEYPPVNGITLLSAQYFPNGRERGSDYSERVYQIMVEMQVSPRSPILIPTVADLDVEHTSVRRTGPDTFDASTIRTPKSRYVVKYRMPDGSIRTSSAVAGEKIRIPSK